MKKQVRIKDVAEKAGVSTGTVDRVIHNRGKVAPLVKERVLAVIKELGFKRNYLASAIATKRNIRVAILFPDSKKDLYWKATQDGLDKGSQFVLPYGVLTEVHHFDLFNEQSFLDGIKVIFKNPPQAIIFPPVFLEAGQDLLDLCEKKNIPTVIVNTNLPTGQRLSYIGQDSYQSGVLAARLLNFGLNTGDTALILNLAKSSINALHLTDKEKGFRNYFEKETDKDIQIIKEHFDDFDNKKRLSSFLKKLQKQYPQLTGIFFTNSRAHSAIDCLDAAAAKKIKMVGFDLIEPNLKYLEEGKLDFLINQNPMDQGYLSFMSLFNQFITKEPIPATQYLPLDIVVKENSAYYLERESRANLVI